MLRQDGGVIYRFAPPVMQLRYKNFRRNSLRCAAPPTPEQPDSAYANPQISRPRGTQNPPVLLSPEMVCSVRQHPLSGNSGRKRYNTLDLCTAKSCANKVLSSLLGIQKSRNLRSLHNPNPFMHLYPQTEKQVCDHKSINAKPQRVPTARSGFSGAAQSRRWLYYSCHIVSLTSKSKYPSHCDRV